MTKLIFKRKAGPAKEESGWDGSWKMSGDDVEIVTVDDCRDCPEDSACHGIHHDGKNICMCVHFLPPEPLKKGEKCPRNTIKSHSAGKINEDYWKEVYNNSAIPIKVADEELPLDSPDVIRVSQPTIIFILALALSTAALLVFFCIFKRQIRRKFFNLGPSSKRDDGPSIVGGQRLMPLERFVANPTYESHLIELPIRVYSQQEVQMFSKIGQGCFGNVYKGVIDGEEIAVKMVKKEFADEAMREVETMATFSHPNILQLKGIIKDPDLAVPWLCFEFMSHGDLASVLREYRGGGGQKVNCKKTTSNCDPTPSDTNEEESISRHSPQPLVLNQELLLDFASQIADGMKYLSSQHFVHRDLAARNCLVSASGVVKISDFGLSRDVYTCDYYKIGGSRLLPLRWMAPESILYGRFTLESDVYTYGVLLWEIFSWGKQPYYGHNNEEVVQLILDGVLLCPPSDCPPTICHIMEGCWKTEAVDRLKFPQICQMIRDREKNGGSQQQNSCSFRVMMAENSLYGKKSASEDAVAGKTNVDESTLLDHSLTNDSWRNSGYEVPRSLPNPQQQPLYFQPKV